MISREKLRLEAQIALDSAKTQDERNRLGQFSTPPRLAVSILEYAKNFFLGTKNIRFLDPALGTGAFYSALIQTFPASRISLAVGFEIDPAYGSIAKRLWAKNGLQVEVADFTKVNPAAAHFDLLICNPPYVRHHHIMNEEKTRLHKDSAAACGIKLSGLSGLYCHFLALSHRWMAEGAIAGWLIPSEFMDVNYGEAVKRYLLNNVKLLHIHRFDPYDMQFDDALVSSSVVWFKKERPPDDYEVEFSFGGSLKKPTISKTIPSHILREESKWTRFPLAIARNKDDSPKISDYFSIRRGLATGDNNFFILSERQVRERKLPWQFFRPILPSPRYLSAAEVLSDSRGNPILDKSLFLLDCHLAEEEIQTMHPELWAYLEEGRRKSVADRYLCKHRSPWYSQEKRPASPFVCTYLGRGNVKSGRPFRFIFNQSLATVTNVYLVLYPKEILRKRVGETVSSWRKIWQILDGICPQSMLAEGRVYGGGLHKLEPKELANVPVPALSTFLTTL